MTAFNRIKIIFSAALLIFAFSSCGTASDSSDAEKYGTTSEDSAAEIDYDLDKRLLENEKNIAGNGYIIINDEADHPDCIKDLRYVKKMDADNYSIRDFYGSELFTLESTNYTPFFSEGISFFYKGDKCGFVDADGEVIIEPRYDRADCFFNDSCFVVDGSDKYFIDKTGAKSEDKRLQGFDGSIEELKKQLGENMGYSNFTGKYMLCEVLARSEDETSILGYADKYGNFNQIENASKIYSFYNGYAAVESINNELYFIDENLQRVTGNIYDLCYDEFAPIDFLDDFTETVYVFEGGYFSTIVESDTEPLGERKLIKIAPELYSAE